jgi:hypothetical protein
MIAITSQGLQELAKAVSGKTKDLKKNLAIAINDTSRFCKSQIAKEIEGTGVNLTQKVIKTALKDSGRANAARLGVQITLKKGFRFGLNAFKARQTKKGVSYSITKKGGATKLPNAFIPKRYGGKVYIRKATGKGSGRGPLRQLRGISPWGVFVKNQTTSLVSEKTQAELNKQVVRRIRFLTLKASGKI